MLVVAVAGDRLLDAAAEPEARRSRASSTAQSSSSKHRSPSTNPKLQPAEAARAKSFPTDYQQLVVLGKAVPGDDETASLLVQLNTLADQAGVQLRNVDARSGECCRHAKQAPASLGAAKPSVPTEAAASLLPLGASIGPAGLAVMPYTLTFEGNFFQSPTSSRARLAGQDANEHGRR